MSTFDRGSVDHPAVDKDDLNMSKAEKYMAQLAACGAKPPPSPKPSPTKKRGSPKAFWIAVIVVICCVTAFMPLLGFVIVVAGVFWGLVILLISMGGGGGSSGGYGGNHDPGSMGTNNPGS
jgi:hypothetical protein